MRRDEALLARTRRRPCFWCRRPPPVQAAHMLTKGFGGWAQIDDPLNVVPCCLECHASHHAGHRPTKDDMLKWLGDEFGLPTDAIMDYLWGILRGERPSSPVLDDPLGG